MSTCDLGTKAAIFLTKMNYLFVLITALLLMPGHNASAGLFMADPPKISLEKAIFGAQSDYSEVKTITYAIMARYPPAQYLYVGVGRSPTPLIAFMKAVLGEEAAVNVPLTTMRAIRGGPYDLARIERKLDIHFDQFLPEASELRGKKVLVIDFALTGRSLEETVAEIRRYFRHDGVTVNGFGLVYANEEDPATKRLRNLQIDHLQLSRRLGDRLFERAYSTYAEFDRFPVLDSVQGPYEKPQANGSGNFQKLKEAFLKKAQADGELRGSLKRRFPGAALLQTEKAGWREKLECYKLLVTSA